MKDNEQLIQNQKPIKAFPKHKEYDRKRDRKDKRLYEIDPEDEEIGVVEKR